MVALKEIKFLLLFEDLFDLWEVQITMTIHQAIKSTEVLTQRLIAICDANSTWYDQCRETWVDTDEHFGAETEWIEEMLSTTDETDEVREALGTGSLSDALVAAANHFGWEKEESDEGSQAAPLVSLASALATRDLKLEHAQLIADADPDDVAEALVDRLTFFAQNNETWHENLRNVFHQIAGKIEEPETEWIVEALDSDNEEPQVRNALINNEAIEIAVVSVAMVMNWI